MTTLIVFGAGDVTSRYILPGVAELVADGSAPDDLSVVVVGRDDADTAKLRDVFRAELDADVLGEEAVKRFVSIIEGRRADVSDVEAIREIMDGEGPYVAYLALPPAVFGPAIETMTTIGLPNLARVAVEKPFGTDSASARNLNDLLHRLISEDAIFRVDHFLGMKTARDLLALRFANRVIEPLWNAEHIDSVEIVWDETLGLAGRAGYYDGTGAGRDMLQNHLLQLMCLVAMEPPRSLSAADLADRKVEVLAAVHPWKNDPAGSSRRARYTAGTVDGDDIASYVDEDDVDPALDTETFAEMRFEVDMPRWRGVPFLLRSGKALARNRHEVAVRFRPATPFDWCDPSTSPNVLRFCLEPTHVALDVALTTGDAVFDLKTVALDNDAHEPALSAYAVMLDDVLRGGNVLSVRDDEAVMAWEVVEPVLKTWQAGEVPLEEYEAGSTGPAHH
jgi:glucose-6-phosphate 1-dehydrogenase